MRMIFATKQKSDFEFSPLKRAMYESVKKKLVWETPKAIYFPLPCTDGACIAKFIKENNFAGSMPEFSYTRALNRRLQGRLHLVATITRSIQILNWSAFLHQSSHATSTLKICCLSLSEILLNTWFKTDRYLWRMFTVHISRENRREDGY